MPDPQPSPGKESTPTRCSVFIAMSLDGYIATETGSLEWLSAAARDDEDYGFDAFLAGVDALAMGRGTYDFIAHIDPLPFAGRPVHVFTHNPPPARPGVEFGSWEPTEAVARWSRAGLRRVYVDGGQLISEFLAAGLISDLLISVVPILLGSGRRLFHPIPTGTDLVLGRVTQFPSGIVNLSYERRTPEGIPGRESGISSPPVTQ